MRTKIDLKKSLDETSFSYLSANFEFHYCATGLVCFNLQNDEIWIKFFLDGRASYCYDGDTRNMIEFKSYQECVDFIRVK